MEKVTKETQTERKKKKHLIPYTDNIIKCALVDLPYCIKGTVKWCQLSGLM